LRDSKIEGLGNLNNLDSITLRDNNIPDNIFQEFMHRDQEGLRVKKLVSYCRKNKL